MITLLGLPSLRTCKPACVQAPFLTLHTLLMGLWPPSSSYPVLVLRSQFPRLRAEVVVSSYCRGSSHLPLPKCALVAKIPSRGRNKRYLLLLPRPQGQIKT